MNETIYLQYPWKIEDIDTGIKYHLKAAIVYKILFIILAKILAILIIFSLVLQYVIHNTFELKNLLDLVFLIACIFINKIFIYIFSYNFRKSNYDNKQIEWEINNDKVINRMINLYETNISWDLLQGVLDTPDGFLLYPQKNMFYWLPKKQFTKKEDIAQFAFIAQDKVKNWQQIK